MSTELPVVSSAIGPRTRSPDLIRTAWGLLLWAPPILLLILTSAFVQASLLPARLEGPLLIGGTFWFGLLCLTNATRCGRVHCWVDGTLLPALGSAALLVEIGLLGIPWEEYLSALWLIVIAGFVAECLVGPYLPRRNIQSVDWPCAARLTPAGVRLRGLRGPFPPFGLGRMGEGS